MKRVGQEAISEPLVAELPRSGRHWMHRRLFAAAIALLGLALPWAGGCHDRSLGGGGADYECWDLWECNPDRVCGEMVPCLEGICRTDLAPVILECPHDECVRESDCLVALPYDCCNGCPQILSREELALEPCFYEAGTQPGDIPLDCLIDCYACPLCFPQPLGSTCTLGLCEATAEGCPSGLPSTPVPTTTAELLESPIQHEGRTYRVTGTVLPGPALCNDLCPAPRCCQQTMLLDGVIPLRGSPCDLRLGFWSNDYCEDGFETEGMLAGGRYELEGVVYLNQSPLQPVSLEVLGVRIADATGVAGAFDVVVTQVSADTSDPVCVPPTLQVGDPGRVYTARSGENALRAAAPMFDCHFEFWGSVSPDEQGWFESRVPIECDVCCCDFLMEGQVVEDRIYGAYSSFDGTCRYEYVFEGTRDPLVHPEAPQFPW